MKCCQKGFSLIECMIVVALSLLLFSLIASNISFMRSWLVRSDLDTLSMVCRYAQQQAMTTNQQQIIQLDVLHNKYSINDKMYHLSPGVCFGIIPGLKGPPGHPITILTNPTTFAQQQIVCSTHGIISSGTVYLTDVQHTVLYALSNAVSHISYLRRYVYTNSWQDLSRLS